MRYLVLSDVHANLPALEAVLAHAAQSGYDQTLVLGDLVGYGAHPGEVIDRVMALSPAAIVRGNHDKVCARLDPASAFNDIARLSIEWTRERVTPAQMQTLIDLPAGPVMVSDRIEICHGSPFDEDYYVFDVVDAERAMEAAERPLCLFGHTHIPTCFMTAPEGPRDSDLEAGRLVRLPPRGQLLVNVGSVGQPRDGDPRAAYGLVDLDANEVRFERVTYDVAAAQNAIRQEGLPEWLAARLGRGQ